ncbi:MAG TPA: manganese efflux pump MntP family protein [Thermogutta sp.]|nr:manganese efflux pump MntP family protein [Thermogutta sp.]
MPLLLRDSKQQVDLLAVLFIALALAMDAFAVSLAVGLRLEQITARHTFRIAFHFGLFQFLMPILGWAIGRQFSLLISTWDHWLAFGILVVLGGKMIWQAFDEELTFTAEDPTRGWSLVGLSIATSVDALAVGVSLAVLAGSVWFPAVIIGLVAAFLSLIGIHSGNWLGRRFCQWGEICGGGILIVLACRILLSHLAL